MGHEQVSCLGMVVWLHVLVWAVTVIAEGMTCVVSVIFTVLQCAAE